MSELFIFTVGTLILAIGAFFEERSRKDARPRRNVQGGRRIQTPDGIKKRLHPIFYEQKSDVKRHSVCKYA